jgi:hypothetical protein
MLAYEILVFFKTIDNFWAHYGNPLSHFYKVFYLVKFVKACNSRPFLYPAFIRILNFRMTRYRYPAGYRIPIKNGRIYGKLVKFSYQNKFFLK